MSFRISPGSGARAKAPMPSHRQRLAWPLIPEVYWERRFFLTSRDERMLEQPTDNFIVVPYTDVG